MATIMTKEERASLQARFEKIVEGITRLQAECLEIEHEFQGLGCLSLRVNLQNAENQASGLADYIEHTIDENWKVRHE